MKRLIILFVIAIFFYSCSKDSDNTIDYTISPITKNGEELLKVKMAFKVKSNETSTLLFQDTAWGQDSLHNVIRDIKVLSEQSSIHSNRDSGWYQITHPKDIKHVELEYTIKQDSEGELTTWDTYRPIIQSDYFHLFSHNFLMLPKAIIDASNNNFNVVIKWEGFPEDYAIVNSFGSHERVQHIEHISEEKFHTAIFTGGDFRIYDINIKGNNVAFAIRGDWKVFQDSTMVNILKKTIVKQRDFWQDHTQDYFAVTLIPTIQERGSSFQGSGLTNSFATNASNNEYLETQGLVYLFNHELQHNWTGHIIKNDNEEEQYWFSEGFTDYYTIKNIAKGNIFNLDESYFINEFNNFIKSLYTSPVKDVPNSEMTYENFWSGKEGMQKLPYRRGAILAFYLDQKIKQDSNGKYCLDNVLLDFKNDALENKQKITHAYFIQTVNNYVNDDFKPFFDTHIENGQLYNLEHIFKNFGFEYTPTSEVFDLGFIFSEDKKSIVSIDENSAAYKVGLRAGDRIISRSYYLDSIEHEAEFTVVRNGNEIAFAYLPVRNAKIPLLKNNQHNKNLLNL
ncbi:M1 family aminopeptidase [uncultured Psychroserpens sp.]|uniref:M1 family aminopeptidase n=1 Tax=uncultured Psychroserpens sp. TaxID=255436 RepID=UPI00260B117B|nr:M1 family aminopeptidase [uncultured Psychroserpens sp.]